jgi:gamma-glutamylcysteine synthetase
MAYWALPKDLFKENASITEQDLRALGLFSAACNLPNTSNFWRDSLSKMSDNFNRADLNSRKGKMIIEMCKAGVAANQSKALFETIADLLKDDLRLKNVFYSLVEQINKSC